MLNKVILVGRLTKEPELRKTPNNVSVCQFTIAVNRPFQNQNGERQADFINCMAWKTQAENLCKYLNKGALIAVSGNIQTRSYNELNGTTRYVTEVVCENIVFLEAKKDNSNYNNKTKQSDPFADVEPQFDVSDDDLPF